jgi:hypothetical protein
MMIASTCRHLQQDFRLTRGKIFSRRCAGGVLLLTMATTFAAACSDGITNAPRADRPPTTTTEFQLPGLEATACQNGGEYPDCKDPLDAGGDPTTELPPPPPPSTAVGGDGGGGTPTGTDDAFAQGPATWIGCTAAGLALVGGAVIGYATWEQYYDVLVEYNSSVLRYAYNQTSENYSAMGVAKHHLNEQTLMLAGAAGITVAGFLGVVAACSPTVALPTP